MASIIRSAVAFVPCRYSREILTPGTAGSGYWIRRELGFATARRISPLLRDGGDSGTPWTGAGVLAGLTLDEPVLLARCVAGWQHAKSNGDRSVFQARM